MKPTALPRTSSLGWLSEENLGRDIADAFRDVGVRMQSDDFKWVAEAVDINRVVGGTCPRSWRT